MNSTQNINMNLKNNWKNKDKKENWSLQGPSLRMLPKQTDWKSLRKTKDMSTGWMRKRKIVNNKIRSWSLQNHWPISKKNNKTSSRIKNICKLFKNNSNPSPNSNPYQTVSTGPPTQLFHHKTPKTFSITSKESKPKRPFINLHSEKLTTKRELCNWKDLRKKTGWRWKKNCLQWKIMLKTWQLSF